MNDVLSNKWFVAASNKQISQQVTSSFLHQVNFATSNEWIFATSNEWLFATSNERLLQRVTSDVTTNNEQRVHFKE